MQSEELAVEASPNLWVKMQSIALAVVAIMLSLGQWNDTKDAVEVIYESVITNFTNELEYEQLEQIKVGQTHDYLQSFMGVAQASKPSKIDPAVNFFYYGQDKYLLTVAVKAERVVGYSIVALTDSFSAAVPYTELSLLDTPMNSQDTEFERYFTDFGNLDYYAESHTLGRNAMFYNLLLATVDYGQMAQPAKQAIQSLNHQLNMGSDVQAEALQPLRQQVPNTFALSEIAPEIMAEALLTQFEFTAFFR
ncbi:ETEC_3214 domain-containing protein [Photobacterium sp. TY1-4]|uniref:ETEC_3214 domain-containing protein n=1 Tax=Photobacterium sp. TY1-4 TaxID=2899122 RepID=UPI0021BF9DB4|nr:ETEC_3214 domain-containing protein [Photobacterium sp. TY1-4]UXI01987.1 hypothetical protein NH461_04165 [Photobacterium sp. TY1-4]